MHDIEYPAPETAAREGLFTLCDPLIPLNTVHDRTEVPCGDTANDPEIQRKSNTEFNQIAEDQQEKVPEVEAPVIKESFSGEDIYNLSHLFNVMYVAEQEPDTQLVPEVQDPPPLQINKLSISDITELSCGEINTQADL